MTVTDTQRLLVLVCYVILQYYRVLICGWAASNMLLQHIQTHITAHPATAKNWQVNEKTVQVSVVIQWHFVFLSQQKTCETTLGVEDQAQGTVHGTGQLQCAYPEV